MARQKPQAQPKAIAALPAALGVATIVAVMIALAPASDRTARAGIAAPAVDPTQVLAIVERRCVPCHAANPTQPGFASAPNGLVFETLPEVREHLAQIQQQLSMRTMPLGNLTGMTEEERAAVLMWIGHRELARP